MPKLLLLCFLLIPTTQAKLLDKVAGVINDKIITLSEIERVQDSINARVEISPIIYKSKNLQHDQLLEIINRIFIIKDKLAALGFVVSDDSVESSITETERRLGLQRAQLLKFLGQKGISFEEYFELIRVTKEYNIFMQRIIAPLVSITEQDLKNYYYKTNSNSKTLSFKYNIVDFYFNKSEIPNSEISRLPSILTEYQKTGNIPEAFKNIQTNNLGKVSDEDLPSELSALLKTTDEKAFSKPYDKNNVIHVFYLKSKDLTESKDYLSKKDYIYNELFLSKSEAIVDSWFDKEKSNYYILNNL